MSRQSDLYWNTDELPPLSPALNFVQSSMISRNNMWNNNHMLGLVHTITAYKIKASSEWGRAAKFERNTGWTTFLDRHLDTVEQVT